MAVPPGIDTDRRRLRDSFASAMRDPDAFGRTFYARLFALAPSARALFPDALEAQQQKLVHALHVLIKGLDNPDPLEPLLRQLGARHVAYGAQAAHYVLVGEALIDTLNQLGEAPLDPEARAAWSRFFGWVAATMLDGAEHAQRRARAEARSGPPTQPLPLPQIS